MDLFNSSACERTLLHQILLEHISPLADGPEAGTLVDMPKGLSALLTEECRRAMLVHLSTFHTDNPSLRLLFPGIFEDCVTLDTSELEARLSSHERWRAGDMERLLTIKGLGPRGAYSINRAPLLRLLGPYSQASGDFCLRVSLVRDSNMRVGDRFTWKVLVSGESSLASTPLEVCGSD